MKVMADKKIVREPLMKVRIELTPDESSILSVFLKNNVEYSHVVFMKDLRDKLASVHSL